MSNNERITRFKEVELRETEFKKASELDDGEFEKIRSEYFRRTFVYCGLTLSIKDATNSSSYLYIR